MPGRRRLEVTLAAVLAASVAIVAPSPAADSGEQSRSAQAGGGPVSLRILSTTQRAIARSGRVRVRMRARRRMRARLTSTAREPGDEAVRAIRTRTMTLPAGRSRTFNLPLAAAGREKIDGCEILRLTVSARVPDRRARAARTVRASRLLRADAAECRRQGGPDSTRPGAQLPASGPGSPAPVFGPVPRPNADEPDAGDDGRRDAGDPGSPCDFLDTSVCLYPWPNDQFTVADPDTDTGRRLSLQATSMPRNRLGRPVDPAEYNRSDGFSPGSKIVTRVPGLDSPEALRRTGAVPIDDMARAFDRDQPIVVINGRTKQRHLIWAEIDSNPADPAQRTLIIRPGKNFDENTRYIVALRNLKNASGETIPAQDGFRRLRDGVSGSSEVEARRAHHERIFRTLGEAGVAREDLYLAWDFTVGSERGLTERMLRIRDDAFAQLGDTNLSDLQVAGRSPTFSVTRVEENPDPRIARRIEGTIQTPCYLTLPGCLPGSRFNYAPGTNRPVQLPGNTHTTRFFCTIPRAAVGADSVNPARASLYGHGLLGSRSEINQGQLRDFGNEHNVVFCATDWIGMSCPDVPTSQGAAQEVIANILMGDTPNSQDCDLPNVALILQDVSLFPSLVDRVQQGMLNFLYLGRAMVHPHGFSSHAAFRYPHGGEQRSVLDTSRLFYDGNSQGGIIGGALAAVGVDHDRAVVGVPGMNYSTLLRRSVDFDAYATGKFRDELPDTPLGLYDNYPNELERPLLLSLMQQLWDRGEANGYAHHMTSDPLPNTPPHDILLHVALGDHQVAQVSAEVEARTIGAFAHSPWADPGRDLDVDSGLGVPGIFGVPPIPYPFAGSGIVLWDAGPTSRGGGRGTPPPPNGNVPPREGDDPHEYPRRTVNGRQQKSAFLSIGGMLIDVCGGRPCYSDGWNGP